MKALTVLSIAYPFAPVGRDSIGGAEQVLSILDRALVRTGHQSLVIACAGSKPAGTLLEIAGQTAVIDSEARFRTYARVREEIRRAIRDFNVDLIHMHGIDFPEYLPDSGIPTLVTLHLPPSWYSENAFRQDGPVTCMVCVSQSQRNVCDGTNICGVIENGVPVDRLKPGKHKARFVLALGRICPEKGFHLAAVAAKEARIPLILGGEVFAYEAHLEYYRQCLEPLLDSKWFRHIGPVGFDRKRRLLSAARCLLAPSLAPETSSLVAMEALACGTPVVAFPAGALAEIVEPGKTGFLVSDENEMAAAIEMCDRIDRDLCRQTALARFSEERMIRQYLDLYSRLAF